MDRVYTRSEHLMHIQWTTPYNENYFVHYLNLVPKSLLNLIRMDGVI